MSDRAQQVIRWAPRVLAILYAVFISLFAFDVWGMAGTFWELLGGFLIHLAPTYAVAALTLIAWKRPLIGGALFIGLAAAFSLAFDWSSNWVTLLLMAGPLVVIGVLFLVEARAEHSQPHLQT